MKSNIGVGFPRRVLLRGGLASGLGLLIPAILQGEEAEKSVTDFITPATDRSINQGLRYLAGRQTEDGAFGTSGYQRNVAICALSGMALMASGSTPGRGPYGKQIDRCVNYLLKNTQPNGFICDSPASSHGPMYGHGFATLFLAQAYGMSNNPQLRKKLSLAVKLIASTQNTEGGWRYQPQPADADISVTVCEMMALRAARNAGLHVPNQTVDRCIEYVQKSQNTDGGFRYMLSGGPSDFPRSAAGVVALFSAGVYEGNAIARGLIYLSRFVPRRRRFVRTSHYFYGHYYAIQAMWHAGDEAWATWYPAIRDELLGMQKTDGSWADAICSEYATAMACLILQIPNNNLPIFQR
ncbi:MAG: terpene cyclase/mutase family protein [Pirellulales bacterium]|nr:terpene cyclase/mutase family protein [Pirellulales bacterium]